MVRIRHCLAAALSLAGLTGTGLVGVRAQANQASTDPTAAKGSQIYCFMRSNGNSHSVSWEASYAVIKRQGNSLFKTSPEHASVMITEAVVNSPGNYPDCGRYLGDLFGASSGSGQLPENQPKTSSYGSNSSSSYGEQRYSY
jgi:hypothetical protein